jgi:hypothetical protein
MFCEAKEETMQTQTNKTLIINPKKDELKDLTLISYEQVIKDLISKVFGCPVDAFKPQLMLDKQLRLFISNVESRTVAVNLYANKQINTFEEALAYLNEVGTKIYGANWKVKLIANEVLLTKSRTHFGLYVPNDDLIKAIRAELSGYAAVTVNAAEVNSNNKQTRKNKQEPINQANNKNESEN